MRSLARLLLGAVAALVVLEVGLRAGAGLGRPVLFAEHPTIEYLPLPDQHVRRLGRRQDYDAAGRRNAAPTDATRRRVLVLGDSVVNGGNPTDQSELATTRLSEAAGDTLYLNASAGSWGPGNLRAWLDVFGFDGADTLVLVLSPHDWTDLRTFEPLNPDTHPVRRPPLAIVEAVQRYGTRWLPAPLAGPLRPARTPHAGRAAFERRPPELIPAELRSIAGRAAGAGVRLCTVLHRARAELDGDPEGAVRLRALFDALEVPVVDLRESLRASLDAGIDPYRDAIHIDAAGQALLARGIARCDGLAAVPARAD